MGIMKLTEIREWAEARINNISSIALNKKLCMDPEQQAVHYDLPVATVILGTGNSTFTGVQSKNKVKVIITLVSYDGGDYESDIENIVEEFEGSAFPNFTTDGDAQDSPGYTAEYNWETYPLPIASPSTDKGKIISIIFIDVDYYSMSNRM